jgi:hypothetical protein
MEGKASSDQANADAQIQALTGARRIGQRPLYLYGLESDAVSIFNTGIRAEMATGLDMFSLGPEG